MNNIETDTVSNIGNLDEFIKSGFGAVVQLIRASHALPHPGDDYEFYRSFPSFQDFVGFQKHRILNLMGILLKNQGLKANFSTSDIGQNNDTDDYTERLVQCNDGFIERVVALLDQKLHKKSGNTDPDGNEMLLPTTSKIEQPKTVVSSWNRVDKHGRSKNFRLLQAYNIARPQLKFKDKIDNSAAPFVPKLTSKPNAQQPLPQALLHLISGQDGDQSLAISNLISNARQSKPEDTSIYEHPYQYELDHWEPLAWQMQKGDPCRYATMKICSVTDQTDDLHRIVSELKTAKEIAVDLEHHSYRSYQGITCLIQLSTRASDYVLDAIALRSELNVLNEVFTDPNIVKVFHGADSDILWLQRDFGLYVVNMFDTGQASRALQLDRHSLGFILNKYCNLVVDKKYQLADWRIRPLPEEMLYYAQGDTHYLLYVYDVMRNALLDRAQGDPRLLRFVLNMSRDVCLQRYAKPAAASPDAHLVLLDRHSSRTAASFDAQQREALRALYAWRDAMARVEDESCGYVLPNHMMLQLAEILPRDAPGVLALCSPTPPLVRQHVLAVHQLIADARERQPRRTAATATPSTKKRDAEKVSFDDILSCPHDLSHRSAWKARESEPSRGVARESKLFGPFHQRCASDEIRHTQLSGGKPAADSEAKLRRLRDQRWNPFSMFMPSAEDDDARKPTADGIGATTTPTLKQMLTGEFAWQLKVEQQEKAAAPQQQDDGDRAPKQFGEVMRVGQENYVGADQQLHVLRGGMGRKRGAKTLTGKERAVLRAEEPAALKWEGSAVPPPRKQPFVAHQYRSGDYQRFDRRHQASTSRH